MEKPAEVSLIARERQYDGFFKLDRFTLRHALFEGGMSPEKQREIFVGRAAICCLPYDPERDKVILVRQFRVGPYAWGDPAPWVLEAPAGFIDPGEDPAQSVHRELAEEAGCTVTDLTHAMEFYPAQGPISEHIRLFVGRAESTGVGGIFGLAEEGEDIAVRAIALDTALDLVDRGEIRTGLGVLPLLWLSRHRDALRRTWGVV